MQLKTILLIGIGWASLAAAQSDVTIPLSNASQPATVNAHLISGSIVVTVGKPGQVVVVTSPGANDRRVVEAPPGMHRIDTGNQLEAEEDHNTVTIGGSRSIAIQVPANCSLKLNTMIGGTIDVTGVNGVIEVDNMNGPVNLKNVSGSVVAHSLNGAITASIDKVAADKPMSFTSMNGKVEVTLPAETKASLRLKSDHGQVFSDFAMKMEADASKPVVEDAHAQGGKYRIRMDRGVYGSINGGGPEYRFETMNGNILIHKK